MIATKLKKCRWPDRVRVFLCICCGLLLDVIAVMMVDAIELFPFQTLQFSRNFIFILRGEFISLVLFFFNSRAQISFFFFSFYYFVSLEMCRCVCLCVFLFWFLIFWTIQFALFIGIEFPFLLWFVHIKYYWICIWISIDSKIFFFL